MGEKNTTLAERLTQVQLASEEAEERNVRPAASSTTSAWDDAIEAARAAGLILDRDIRRTN